MKLKMEKNNLIFKSDLLGVVDLSFSAVSVGAFILFNCVLAHSFYKQLKLQNDDLGVTPWEVLKV